MMRFSTRGCRSSRFEVPIKALAICLLLEFHSWLDTVWGMVPLINPKLKLGHVSSGSQGVTSRVYVVGRVRELVGHIHTRREGGRARERKV